MRLGIISDTHGMLRPEVFDVFSEVDRILHAGDVGSVDLLSELEALAPVSAVYGNTDGFDVRGRCGEVVRLELDGLNTVVTHGDRLGSPTPAKLVSAFPDAELIVFGHTHRALIELVDRTITVVNPGSAGAARFGVPPSVAIAELEVGLPPRARVVHLLPD